MSKPRLLDLFCGAGGAAMGYHRAGFEVVGVDIKPQPHYPFEFHQADALTFPLEGFDAIHASPPCQAYSIAANIHGAGDHPRLIEPVRERLLATGLPYVIENVPGAPLRNYAIACGLSFGLNVKRHRWFESNILLMMPPCGRHEGDWVLVFGHTVLERSPQIGRTPKDGPRFRRRHLGTDVGPSRDGYRLDDARRTQSGHPARVHAVDRRAADGPPEGSSMTALTELHDEILEAIERAGYPHVAICRIDSSTYGAAAFRTLRELSCLKPGDFVGRGSSRQEALGGVLERVA